jgi:hypothetical protein
VALAIQSVLGAFIVAYHGIGGGTRAKRACSEAPCVASGRRMCSRWTVGRCHR